MQKGQIADNVAFLNLENNVISEFDIEIVRSVGRMTEHTGEKIYLQIIR